MATSQLTNFLNAALWHISAPLLHAVAHLFPKRKNLVCCSEWSGVKRGDNAHAFFVHMSKNSKLDVFWLHREEEKFNKMERLSRHVYQYSLLGIWLQLRAGVFVYSNGKSDFIRALVTRRSLCINLWHGIPLKKVYYATKKEKQTQLVFHLVELRNFLLPYFCERPDYILTHNTKFSQIMQQSFRPYSGTITGKLPRWMDLANASGCPLDGKRSLVYCPTFRDSNTLFTPLNEVDLLSLNRRLEKDNLRLFVKLHPVTPRHLNFEPHDNIDYFPEGQEVLSFARRTGAILISDVSSLIVDAINLDIPVAIFFPDLTSYLRKSRSTNINYQDFIGEINHTDIFDLLDNLKDPKMWSVDKDQWSIFLADPVDIWDEIVGIIGRGCK